MKKFFLIFIIIFSLIGFVGCTQKDDTKSQFTETPRNTLMLWHFLGLTVDMFRIRRV